MLRQSAAGAPSSASCTACAAGAYSSTTGGWVCTELVLRLVGAMRGRWFEHLSGQHKTSIWSCDPPLGAADSPGSKYRTCLPHWVHAVRPPGMIECRYDGLLFPIPLRTSVCASLLPLSISILLCLAAPCLSRQSTAMLSCSLSRVSKIALAEGHLIPM